MTRKIAERAVLKGNWKPERKQVRQSVQGWEQGSGKSGDMWVIPGLELELGSKQNQCQFWSIRLGFSGSWLWVRKGLEGAILGIQILAQLSIVV